MKRKVILIFLSGAAILLAACGVNTREELNSATLIVTNGTVIDGTGADPIPDGLVAMDGSRIIAVGRAADYLVPDGAAIIDAAGGTILPGIINAHVHKVSSPATRRILFLLDGVTSVCDMMISVQMMSDLDEGAVQAGPAARGFKSGPMITAPGGYPGVIFGTYNSYQVQGAAQAESAVNDLIERGADYIKLALEPGVFGDPWPVLGVEEVRTAVQIAHAHGLLVRAHVNNAALDIALEGQIDVIEHVALPSFSYEDLAPMFNEAGEFQIPDQLNGQLLKMVDQQVIMVPTLDVIIKDTYLEGSMDPADKAVAEAVLAVVGFYHRAGGTIALGNDYGNSGVEPGMPLDEMAFLQAAGLSPMEIIEAATNNAAYVCGQAQDLGTLEVGKLADVIVVSGDPLEDFIAFDSVLYVVKDGEVAVSPQLEGK